MACSDRRDVRPQQRPAGATSFSDGAYCLAAVVVWAALMLVPPVSSPAAQPGAPDDVVPHMPDGPPARLLECIADLRKGMPPPSRESLPRQKEIASSIVVAADNALVQLRQSDDLYLVALREKLDALDILAVADRDAAATRRDIAASLCDSPSPAVALEGRLRLLNAGLLDMHWSRSTHTGPALIALAATVLADNCDDETTALRVVKWAGALEFVPDGGSELAVAAYARLAPMLAKSVHPKVAKAAEILDGKRLRLTIHGEPVDITGTLLDGTPFDPAPLRGKVVIVAFWATWCEPCMAEIPALRKLHDTYQAKGLEVVLVSLDTDADAVKAFVADSQVRWPILFAGRERAFDTPLATRHGITSIPQLFLLGRDGTLVVGSRELGALATTVGELCTR